MHNLPKLNHFMIDDYLLQALHEDITYEDASTNCVIEDGMTGKVNLIAKVEGRLAGLDVFERVFTLLDAATTVEQFFTDGERVQKGDCIAVVRGRVRVLLSGERVAINYLQRMSGIATYTARMAEALEGSNTVLVDTRKTTPNMRVFEKYAVVAGGGKNHRYNLSDGIMLKDNHIAAAGSVTKAIERARSYVPFVRKIEVEVENFAMLEEALAAGADIIMFDNMSCEEVAEAVHIVDGRAETEVSGNISLENIRTYGHLGVDYISSGSLTHSAPILDLSMKGLEVCDD